MIDNWRTWRSCKRPNSSGIHPGLRRTPFLLNCPFKWIVIKTEVFKIGQMGKHGFWYVSCQHIHWKIKEVKFLQVTTKDRNSEASEGKHRTVRFNQVAKSQVQMLKLMKMINLVRNGTFKIVMFQAQERKLY